MANENCLKNIACPACGSMGPFEIEVTTTVTVHDDGTDLPSGDINWGEWSRCACTICRHRGYVKTFTNRMSTMKQGLREVLRSWPSDDPQGIETIRDLIEKCKDSKIEVIREEIFYMINIVETDMEQDQYNRLLSLLQDSLMLS